MPEVKVSELSEAVYNAVMEYSSSAEEKTKKCIDKTARKVLNSLRSNPIIPRSMHPRAYSKSSEVSRKHYADLFRMTPPNKRQLKNGYTKVVVYNKKYRITHLLEKGRRNGPPMPTFPHWAQAQKIAETLYPEIAKELHKK